MLLDESLVEFSDAQPIDTSLKLLERYPRLLVFRSFSKAWGLAGLRVGYALGGPGSEDLLAELEPDLGVSEVSQAGALEALRSCSALLERRVRTRSAPSARADRRPARARLRGQPTARRTSCGPSTPLSPAASSLRAWRAPGVLVAEGDALGEPRHVRIGDRAASERRDAIDRLLAAPAKR